MPAPAAQFSPELPWAAGTRGTIVLKEPVTKDDLVNGALTFINGNGQLYQPEDTDGYVDYCDENDSQVLSIAIGDDESKIVVVASVAQDADVQRVVVGPAVGSTEGFAFVNENLQELAVGESGFVVVSSSKEAEGNYSVATQDGRNGITCKRVADYNQSPVYELINRETPVTIISTLKLPSATPGGVLANLPKILCELYNDNGSAVLRALHAPAEDQVEGAVKTSLFKQPYQQAYWDDQVTRLLAK